MARKIPASEMRDESALHAEGEAAIVSFNAGTMTQAELEAVAKRVRAAIRSARTMQPARGDMLGTLEMIESGLIFGRDV